MGLFANGAGEIPQQHLSAILVGSKKLLAEGNQEPMRIRAQILLYAIALWLSPVLRAQTSATPPATSPQATPTPATDSPEVTKLRSDLESARKMLMDWPNLGRYRDANAQVAPPAKNEERVVFMGDSITDGWGRHYGT